MSNHISWCDILIHLEGHFCSFVARSNTQDTPFIGLIACGLPPPRPCPCVPACIRGF